MAEENLTLSGRQIASETKITNHEKHFDRLDATVEKLVEVSIQLKEIVKNQENEILGVKNAHQNLSEQVERRREIYSEMFDNLRGELRTQETKFKTELTNLETTIGQKIQDLGSKITTNVGWFEKWKFTIFGAGLVILFILDKLPIIENLFKVAS
jgi:hypothetical protein